MQSILPHAQYTHFVTLSVAISILLDPQLVRTRGEYARSLLHYFNDMGAFLYGDSFLTYNQHNLVHLYDTACEFGSLEKCSAWKYESYLHRLGSKVRIGRNPIASMVKRLTEAPIPTPIAKPLSLSLKPPNHVYYTTDKKYVALLYKTQPGQYLARHYRVQPVFMEPCDSNKYMGVATCSVANYDIRIVHANELKSRCLMFNAPHDKLHFSCLNHTV